MPEQIGIAGIGLYLPEERMTGETIAQIADLPVEVVKKKMGIIEKPIPGPHDHAGNMGIKAAREAITQAGIDPAEIDVVIYIGEEHKEYPVWTAGIKLQHEVGATNAWAFDTALRCGTTILGIKLAQSLMLADDTIQTVLLAGGYRNVDLVDYHNPRTRFLYNLGAGGGALLLQKGYGANQVLASHLISDGSFSEDVIVPAGGTKNPVSANTLAQRLHYLEVPDPAGMKERLEEKSLHHFITAIRTSLEKSGYTEKDLDYLGILHMKRSAHDGILRELGLAQEQSIYLDHYGHIGQIDQILSLQLGLEQGKIKEGDIVVLVSAGIGYAWGATTMRWGQCKG